MGYCTFQSLLECTDVVASTPRSYTGDYITGVKIARIDYGYNHNTFWLSIITARSSDKGVSNSQYLQVSWQNSSAQRLLTATITLRLQLVTGSLGRCGRTEA